MATVTTQASAPVFWHCASRSRFLSGSSAGKLNRANFSVKPMASSLPCSFRVLRPRKESGCQVYLRQLTLMAGFPGDNGFDQLGLAEDHENLRWYVQAELVNGRWAMLGVAGMLLPEVFTSTGIINVLKWHDAGKAENFASSSTLFVIEFILFHYVEIRRWQDIKKPRKCKPRSKYSLPPNDAGYPGGIFNPLNFQPTLEAKEKETANGRLAMLAFLGFIV